MVRGRDVEYDAFKIATNFFELLIPDQREVFTDEIKMPTPDESTDGLEDAPGVFDKLFERELEDFGFLC